MMSKKSEATSLRSMSSKMLVLNTDPKKSGSFSSDLDGPTSLRHMKEMTENDTPKQKKKKKRRRKRSSAQSPAKQVSGGFRTGLTFRAVQKQLQVSKTFKQLQVSKTFKLVDMDGNHKSPKMIKVAKPGKVIISGSRKTKKGIKSLKSGIVANRVVMKFAADMVNIRSTRKRVEAAREEHVENQFNSDLKINLLRTALETFITRQYENSLLEAVHATVPLEADNDLLSATQKDLGRMYRPMKQKQVGWKVADEHIQQMHDIVALYGSDAIHSRGMFGETILHQVILMKKSSSTPYINDAIARYFINHHASLLNMTYASELYWGEVALHICAVNGERYLFNELIQAGADVAEPRAAGQFFMPFPQSSLTDAYLRHPAPLAVRKKFRDSESYIYYGEYVLSFAAANERVDMVDAAVAAGADVNAQDTLGNTAMHVLLYLSHKFDNNCAEVMIPELLRHNARQDILNRDGYTCLVLATKLGNRKALTVLMAHYRVTNWIYGHVSSFSYNLAMLDSLEPDPESMDRTDSYGRGARPITGDDIERELGLEDENEADRLELGIGNVKVAPELEESDAAPNASSDGGRRRISHTLITPINDDENIHLCPARGKTIKAAVGEGQHPDVFEFSWNNLNDANEDDDEPGEWIQHRAGCCCLITQRQFMHIEALKSLETKAGAKPVVLKRWCCGAADLLRNHDSQHVPTVLTVAVHERRRDILQTPVVKMIFEHKWEAFGRRDCRVKTILVLVHLIILMISVYSRPVVPGDIGAVMAYSEEVEGNDLYVRLFFEVLSILTALALVIYSLIGQDNQHPCLAQVYTSSRLIIHAVCLLLVAAERMLGFVLLHYVLKDYTPGTEYPKYIKSEAQGDYFEALYLVDAVFLFFAIIVGWIEFIFLLKGQKKIGLLVVTLEHMLLQEMLQFFAVFLIVVLMFSQAFFVIFSTSVFPENTVVRRRNNTGMWNENPFSSRVENIIFVLRSALVPDDISEFDYANTNSLYIFGQFVWIIFILISSILLLNLLIAIFNNKFNDFVQVADEEWFIQRTKNILRAERFTHNRKRWYEYMKEREEFKELAPSIENGITWRRYALDVTV